MRPREILHAKKSLILRICESYGASNVRVFGSVARGEATEASDIDLLVEFTQPVSLLDHAQLVRDLERITGCKVDVVSDKGIKPRIRERILKEARPL
ncbi:DNA polymerase beta domain protein region [Spirochaeta thermophila DSM 6578]|uniref:DNA polymerase beta domain protein region n=1 Tax=Winmispira thermophila (strain ATCC 700085 / DSM 6578 / Z-1203) TaxID=869211 RepID=G0GAW0_WINT7|nr:nucleotidyltransferase [Spirochaeta thermophila]AEJ61856.1 DNA polymerase beta domain protein region [Spirochaeta thermophila DSM 6578]